MGDIAKRGHASVVGRGGIDGGGEVEKIRAIAAFNGLPNCEKPEETQNTQQ